MNALTKSPPAPTGIERPVGAGAADHAPARAIPLNGQPHPLFTPALGRILAARADQIARGHTAERDDATGAHALTGIARAKLLKTLQRNFHDAEQELQAVGDATIGQLDRLDPALLAIADRRLATAAALCLATMDLLDRVREGATGNGQA